MTPPSEWLLHTCILDMRRTVYSLFIYSYFKTYNFYTLFREIYRCVPLYVQYIDIYFAVSFWCHLSENCIGDVLIVVLTSSAIDHGFQSWSVKQTIKLVFAASLSSTQHKGNRAKTNGLRIMIMCPSGETCLSADCCFSELALSKSI
jgi:hypothetical protein